MARRYQLRALTDLEHAQLAVILRAVADNRPGHTFTARELFQFAVEVCGRDAIGYLAGSESMFWKDRLVMFGRALSRAEAGNFGGVRLEIGQSERNGHRTFRVFTLAPEVANVSAKADVLLIAKRLHGEIAAWQVEGSRLRDEVSALLAMAAK